MKFFRSSIAFSLVLALAIGPLSSPLFAELTVPASPVRATPFDGPLARAGFCNIEAMPVLSKGSVDGLFMRARSFRYVHEAGSTHWQSPEETASRGAGDCKDKSIWLYAAMKKAGYTNVQLVIGRYRDIDRVLHAWITYTDEAGNTILLDPAKQKRPWNVGEFSPELYKSLYYFDGQNRYRCD